MKVVYEYSHLGGSEILKVRYPGYEREIYQAISEVRAQRTTVSKDEAAFPGRAGQSDSHRRWMTPEFPLKVDLIRAFPFPGR